MKNLHLPRLVASICFGAAFASSAVAQGAPGAKGNLDAYYRFPLSFGVEYQSLRSHAAAAGEFGIFDVSAAVRLPLRGLPSLQPFVKGGLLRFDSQDKTDPYRWDHSHWYGLLGLAYARRFERSFEIGADLGAGLSYSLYPDLLPDVGPVSGKNLLVEAGGRIALDPSFNLCVELRPFAKYLRSLGPLDSFDGILLGLGVGLSYRFGEDPDSPRAIIRSLDFSKAAIGPLFAAMQSYYASNPIGAVTIRNVERQAITDVQVFFFQQGFMDSRTLAATIPSLAPGETREIPLLASFNAEVFRTEGATPLSGEVIATYRSGGRPAEQRHPVSYDLYDKSAIVWNDDRKVGAFITPQDSALRNYASFARQACKAAVLPAYNEALQTAAEVFEALGVLGCLYQSDPSLPFVSAQGNAEAVDSISLPRDTLRRTTGDCDDLTTLYCSLLESAGVKTGYITVPGHIYAAFGTGEAVKGFRQIHPDRELFIALGEELWVPVEITLIGKAGFVEAWRKGVEEWKAQDAAPGNRRLFETRKSQALFRPVGLKESDLGVQYGSADAIGARFAKEIGVLADAALAGFAREAEAAKDAKGYNALGIAAARLGRLAKAEEAFKAALRADPKGLSGWNNLGNVQFLRKDYKAALAQYEEALRLGEAKGSPRAEPLVNIGRCRYELGDYEGARAALEKARLIDAGLAAKYAYLAAGAAESAEGGRASGASDAMRGIMFMEEAPP